MDPLLAWQPAGRELIILSQIYAVFLACQVQQGPFLAFSF